MKISYNISELRFDLGCDYLKSASFAFKVTEKEDKRIPIFLLLQSLELIFSAFIIFGDEDFNDLNINLKENYEKYSKAGSKLYQKYGHDILDLYKECRTIDEEYYNSVFNNDKLDEIIRFIHNNCPNTVDARFPERGKINDFIDKSIFDDLFILLNEQLKKEYFTAFIFT